jgi:pyridoxamine 5'-phosphate oxidase
MSSDDLLDLAAMRRNYVTEGLCEEDLAPTWLAQLRAWIADAARHELLEPNAIILSTAGADGVVSSRTVLVKGLGEDGLTFFTNYRSRKGRQLTENPRAALLFPWHPLQRQVHLEGPVTRISAAESDAYWATRPRGSQIGAAASAQSSPLAAREELEAAARDLERAYEGADVPRPEHWGGFRLAPDAVEFWQGRLDRLHDRLRYRRKPSGWLVERLAP